MPAGANKEAPEGSQLTTRKVRFLDEVDADSQEEDQWEDIETDDESQVDDLPVIVGHPWVESFLIISQVLKDMSKEDIENSLYGSPAEAQPSPGSEQYRFDKVRKWKDSFGGSFTPILPLSG
ncbi:hypothetical protein FS749_006815 [Ceratobasidium sp. UAMH 11750]|nr:hypothetical protein FS749_006815 [Ceratobasidium sp. UAMH 11750]